MDRRRKLLFPIFATSVGLIIGLAFGEVCLRVVGFSSPDLYRADDTLGYAFTPGVEGRYTKEGESYVKINSDGLRDVEHSIEKPAGTFRIAIVGDSFTSAVEVEQNERFSTYLTDGLNGCAPLQGKSVEIMTFGVLGYGTAQELLLIREKVSKYSPDLIVLQMTTNNDITDNARFFRKDPIPYFVLRDGQLVLDESYKNDSKFRFNRSALKVAWTSIYNHVRVFQAIAQGVRALKYRSRAEPAPRHETNASSPAPPPPLAEPGIENEIYREPSTPEWHEAWQVTEALISAARDEATKNGAKFMLVTGSNGIQVLPDAERRTAFARSLAVTDLYYPDRRIAAFGAANSIPVITLAPALADFAARENVFLHGFGKELGNGHWNQTGHKIVGQILSQRMCEGVLQ